MYSPIHVHPENNLTSFPTGCQGFSMKLKDLLKQKERASTERMISYPDRQHPQNLQYGKTVNQTLHSTLYKSPIKYLAASFLLQNPDCSQEYIQVAPEVLGFLVVPASLVDPRRNKRKRESLHERGLQNKPLLLKIFNIKYVLKYLFVFSQNIEINVKHTILCNINIASLYRHKRQSR